MLSLVGVVVLDELDLVRLDSIAADSISAWWSGSPEGAEILLRNRAEDATPRDSAMAENNQRDLPVIACMLGFIADVWRFSSMNVEPTDFIKNRCILRARGRSKSKESSQSEYSAKLTL